MDSGRAKPRGGVRIAAAGEGGMGAIATATWGLRKLKPVLVQSKDRNAKASTMAKPMIDIDEIIRAIVFALELSFHRRPRRC
jgi:hypothetical protein